MKGRRVSETEVKQEFTAIPAIVSALTVICVPLTTRTDDSKWEFFH